MDIESYVKDSVDISEGSPGDIQASGADTVMVYRQYYADLSANEELTSAIEKRFKGKRTCHGAPTYKDIAMWCLCTHGYSVSQQNLSSTSNVDVEAVWEFIDTLSVSSTEKCRDLISRGKQSRSSIGFRKTYSDRHNLAFTRRRQLKTKERPTMVKYNAKCCAGYDTIEEAMSEDFVQLASRTSNPLEECIRLHSELCDRR
jgi:hypothetical protein